MHTMTSTVKHFLNFDAYCITEISSILHNTYIVFKNLEKIVFYIDNYID